MTDILTFSGSANSAYTAPAGWTVRGDPFNYGPDGASIVAESANSYSQIVSDTVASGIYYSEITFNRIATTSADSIAATLITTSRNGIAAELGGSTLYINKQVSGGNVGLITSVAGLGQGLGLNKIKLTLNIATGAFEVFYNNTSVATGTYTDFLSGLNAGSSFYRDASAINLTLTNVTTGILATETIDTIGSSGTVRVNSTGNAITTTGLGTLTSLTIGGKAATSLSATGGDGTFSFPNFADGVTYPAMGSQTAVAGDGTKTASASTTLALPTTMSAVTLTSVVTSAGYIGNYITCTVGDAVYFPTAASLSVTANQVLADGEFQTDYVGTQTIRHWNHTTNVITDWIVTTGGDTTPNSFSFTPVTNSAVSTVNTSNTITVSGIDTATPISISGGGGTYSKNGGSYTATSGTVVSGDTVSVRLTSSASNSTLVSTTLTIGGVSATYNVTTAGAGDTTPNPFTFTDVTNATISTVYTSNTVTISGIDTATAISITGGTYSINGGAYTATSGTVTNGQTVSVRVTSSGSFSTAVNGVLTVGGISDTYTVTTQAIDTTPDAFTFTDQTGVPVSTLIESNQITVSGINSPAAISVTGGEYAVNTGSGFGAFTTSSSTVANGSNVKVRHTSSASLSSAVNTVLTIGGVSDTFTTTTPGLDLVPDQFTFTDITGAALNTLYTSNAITVSGVTASQNIAISVTGGQYAVSTNGGSSYGSYTSSAGNVQLGHLVKVQQTSSAISYTATNTTLTIGGVTDTYTVTTAIPQANRNPAVSGLSVTSITAQAVVTDADGDTMSYSVTRAALNGTAAVNNSTGVITYTADGGFTGSDNFAVTVIDGVGGSSVINVNVGNTNSRVGIGGNLGLLFFSIVK